MECMEVHEMKWSEMKWNGITCHEINWNVMKWHEMQWMKRVYEMNELHACMKWMIEMSWHEMKWIRSRIKTRIRLIIDIEYNI